MQDTTQGREAMAIGLIIGRSTRIWRVSGRVFSRIQRRVGQVKVGCTGHGHLGMKYLAAATAESQVDPGDEELFGWGLPTAWPRKGNEQGRIEHLSQLVHGNAIMAFRARMSMC